MFQLLRKLPPLLLILFLFTSAAVQANSDALLTGEHVDRITRMFLRNHFSNLAFDDTHSREMLNRFMDRFDPGHYYFLQSDVDEFRRLENQLDDQIRRGNIGIAYKIYDRFLLRFKQRRALLPGVLDDLSELDEGETFLLDRSEVPYPGGDAEAARLFTKRLQREFLEFKLRDQSEQEARENLVRRYKSLNFRFERFTRTEVVTAFLNAFTRSYDPHSAYLSPDDYENFNISMRLSLEGIGATLRWEDGYTIITSIIPGGAASRQGSLKPEDKIMAVGQGESGPYTDVTNFRLIDVVKLIRGKRGTTVRLGFMRKEKGLVEKRYDIAITRDKIVLRDGEAKGKMVEHTLPDSSQSYRIAVITLPSFYVDFAQRNKTPNNFKSASRDIEKLLLDYEKKGVNGLILDLRNNGGGGLDEAVSVAGLMLNRGPVVQVKDLRNRVSVLSNPHQRPIYRGPLVVLVNRFSASASEIVAGALQDYGRAVIVGDRATFGKGTVQNIITLPRGLGALKTTVAKFYRPGSSSTQHRGVQTDITLPSLNNHLEIGESSLDNALQWDRIKRARFKPWHELSAMLPALREKSGQRIKQDEYFINVEKEVREYLKTRKDRKSITAKQMMEEIRQGQNKTAPAGASAAPPPTGHETGDAPPKEEDNADGMLEETIRIAADFIRLMESQASRSIATGSGS